MENLKKVFSFFVAFIYFMSIIACPATLMYAGYFFWGFMCLLLAAMAFPFFRSHLKNLIS